MVSILVTYWLYFLFPFYRASFERFVKNMGDFCFQNLCCLPWIFFQNIYFENKKYIYFSYIDTKEMGNRDAVKVCLNVEIKFWFMQKKKSYYLIILVLRWKILYLFLDNGLLLSRNQVFCLKKSKFEKAPIQVKFIIFLWNFAHVFS